MSEWTQSQVDLHNLRVSKENRIPVTMEGVEDESELHSDILAECRRRGWLALHGSQAHKAKRTLGEPDFVILADREINYLGYPNREGFVLLVECKTRTGKLTPAQQALHAHARKLGHEVHVVRSMDEFLALL